MASLIITPLGFRFVPRDVELMKYLFNKVHGFPLPSSAIREVDVYGYHPRFLAAEDREEKFYFVKRKRHSKNKNGKRPSRVQEGHAYAYDEGIIDVGGWWKATTGTKDIYSEGGMGFKRTLKFYSFKNNNKERSQATGTDWIMHEYNLHNTEFQEWVICGIKYKGEESKAVGGSSRGEYLDDSCAVLATTTTSTVVKPMLLVPNQDQDLTVQAGGGTKKYEEEEDKDLNHLHHLEVNWNNISITEDDQNSSKVLASEKEDLGSLNSQVVERHKQDEFMMSNIYGHRFINHGYHDLINEDSQNLSEQVFEYKDIGNWNSPVVNGIEQNKKAVRSYEHDDWLSGLYTFVNGGYDRNQQPLQQVQPEADLMNIEDD